MSQWKQHRDPLFRGDASTGITAPTPVADPNIVRHILYLDGPQRPTPYLSTTEDREVAARFAGRMGTIWETRVPALTPTAVRHISRKELLDLLKGKGKGDATWPSALEVAQARRYVEEWDEHLLDWRDVPDPAVRATLETLFQRSRR